MERFYLWTLRSWRYCVFNLITPHRSSNNSHALDMTSPFITATLLQPPRCQTHRRRYWDRGEESESDKMRQGTAKRDRDAWRAKAIQSTLLHNHGWQKKMRLYIIWWIQDEGGFTLCLSMRNWACPAIVTDHRDTWSVSSSVIPVGTSRTPFRKVAKNLPRGNLDGVRVLLKRALSLSRW